VAKPLARTFGALVVEDVPGRPVEGLPGLDTYAVATADATADLDTVLAVRALNRRVEAFIPLDTEDDRGWRGDSDRGQRVGQDVIPVARRDPT
jgi:hypothetical protein